MKSSLYARILSVLLVMTMAFGLIGGGLSGTAASYTSSAGSFTALVSQLSDWLSGSFTQGDFSVTYTGSSQLSASQLEQALSKAAAADPKVLYSISSWNVSYSQGPRQLITYTVTRRYVPDAVFWSVDSFSGANRAVGLMLVSKLTSMVLYVRDPGQNHASSSSTDQLLALMENYVASSGDDYNIYSLKGVSTLVSRPPFGGSAYSGYFIRIDLEYNETKEQTQLAHRRAQALVNSMPAGLSDADKVRYVNRNVCLFTEYATDLTSRSVYTAYGSLIGGSAVCQGYTLAAQRMLTLLGVENRIVEGTAGGQPHAWNLVKVDGQWLHLDTTWNDTAAYSSAGYSDEYTLRDDAFMRSSEHVWNEKAYTASSNNAWIASRKTLTSHTMTIPIGKSSMVTDGVSIPLPVAPVIRSDKTMLPARSIVDLMGGVVKWEEATSRVLLTLNGRELELTVNKRTALVGGSTYILEVPPQIIGSSTVVPVRFVAENLGCTVDWDPLAGAAILRYTTQ